MARPRQITAQLSDADAPIDADYQDRTELENDIQSEEQAFAQAFGQDTDDIKYYFDMHRIREGTNKRPKLFSGTRSDLDNVHDRLLRGYGTGDYEARIWREEGGKKFLHRKMLLSVEAPMSPIFAPAPTQPQESQAVLQSLQNQQEILRTLLEKQNQAPVPRAPLNASDWIGIIGAAAAALPVIKEVLVSKQPQTNPFEMVTGLLEVLKGANEDGREKGMFDLMSDFLKSPVAEKLAEQMQFAAPAAQVIPPRQIAAPSQPFGAPTQTPLPDIPVTVAPQPQPIQEQELRRLLQFLVSRAMKNSEPELYADWLLDQENLQGFLPMLAQPGALDYLITIDPNIAVHRAWFEQVLYALLTIEDEPAQSVDNVPGLHPAPVTDNQNP